MAAFTRKSDGTEYGLEDGLENLAPYAFDALCIVARTFAGVITYKELAEQLEKDSGLSTAMGLQNWIGSLLNKVVHLAHDESLPPITALVVRTGDGMVGDGYDMVLAVAGEPMVADKVAREEHAAAARFSCYRYFGATIPEEAVPMMSKNYADTLERKRKRNEKPVVDICESCFLELPSIGICAACD